MRVALRVTAGRNTGKEIPVRARRFLIGRADDCQLMANSTQVSRYHCAVLLEDDDSVWVRDYGSRNGTYVGGERINDRRQLADGDQLQVAPLHFAVVIERTPASAHDTKQSPSGDTSRVGKKFKTTLRAIERQERPTNEGDILDIVSQPVERRVAPLPELIRESDVQEEPPAEPREPPPKPKVGPVLPPDPVNPADAAIDGLKRLFTPKNR